MARRRQLANQQRTCRCDRLVGFFRLSGWWVGVATQWTHEKHFELESIAERPAVFAERRYGRHHRRALGHGDDNDSVLERHDS